MRYLSFCPPLFTRNFRIGGELFSDCLPRNCEAMCRELTPFFHLVYSIT